MVLIKETLTSRRWTFSNDEHSSLSNLSSSLSKETKPRRLNIIRTKMYSCNNQMLIRLTVAGEQSGPYCKLFPETRFKAVQCLVPYEWRFSGAQTNLKNLNSQRQKCVVIEYQMIIVILEYYDRSSSWINKTAKKQNNASQNLNFAPITS